MRKTTMKTLIVSGFTCLISLSVHAAVPCSDTIPQKTAFKISRRQFLEKYGKDDTSSAIINYYFKERRFSTGLTIIGASGATLGGIKLGQLATSHPVHQEIGNVAVLLAAVGIFMWMSIFTLLGIFLFVHHSRKHLLKILDDYFSGKALPASLRKSLKKNKRLFKKVAHVSD